MNARGTIRNRAIANIVRNYLGLRWRNITPTDLDGFIDFGNKCFVIIELKFGQANVPNGQALAIERLADSIEESGKCSIAIVARYETCGDIDVAMCIVEKIRFNHRWIQIGKVTVKNLIDRFLKRYAPEYLNDRS